MAIIATNPQKPGCQATGRILIALATYMERDNLAPLIQEIHIFVPQPHVLIIDDNSPDATGQLADELAARDPCLHVMHRPGKLGLGTAVVDGMAYAMNHGYDLFVTMDADFSHPPRYLPNLLVGMRGYDLMIGSRYIPGGGVQDWPWSRRLMSAGVNALVRLLLRIPAHDCSGNFRCYRVAKLRQIDLKRLLSCGYSFQEEMLNRCFQAGLRLGETPILFEIRKSGFSKVNLREAARSLGVLLWLGILAIIGGFQREKGVVT